MPEEEGGFTLPPVDFPDTITAVNALRPFAPFCLFRPHTIIHRVHEFRSSFAGTIAYAVRANSASQVLAELHANGIDWFAVNSLAELELITDLMPDARKHLTAVVKAPELVELAYRRHRVRSFVVDHPREFNKIRQFAGPDSTILVRLNVPDPDGRGEGDRFGCSVEGGAHMLRTIVEAGYKIGLSVDIGTQVMNPRRYDEAFTRMREVLRRAPYRLDMVSMGGGFPALYSDATPPGVAAYLDVITKGLTTLNLPRTCRTQIEPGRALVADCLSVVVRIELRRGRFLYINDGLLGLLNTLNKPLQPTMRLLKLEELKEAGVEQFSLSGPAGYVNDLMPGPFTLPDDTAAGDYIEFGQMGAYSLNLRTQFHNAPAPRFVAVGDSSPFIIMPEEYYGRPAPDDEEEVYRAEEYGEAEVEPPEALDQPLEEAPAEAWREEEVAEEQDVAEEQEDSPAEEPEPSLDETLPKPVAPQEEDYRPEEFERRRPHENR